jgi:hypothetical protein
MPWVGQLLMTGGTLHLLYGGPSGEIHIVYKVWSCLVKPHGNGVSMDPCDHPFGPYILNQLQTNGDDFLELCFFGLARIEV